MYYFNYWSIYLYFLKIGEGEDTTNEYDTKNISLAHALSGPGI